MSKKSKKARRPNVPMYTGPVMPKETAGGGAAPTAIQPAARAPRGGETINADYTHVIGDLKRIAVLAGSLIAILIALSFFIK